MWWSLSFWKMEWASVPTLGTRWRNQPLNRRERPRFWCLCGHWVENLIGGLLLALAFWSCSLAYFSDFILRLWRVYKWYFGQISLRFWRHIFWTNSRLIDFKLVDIQWLNSFHLMSFWKMSCIYNIFLLHEYSFCILRKFEGKVVK